MPSGWLGLLILARFLLVLGIVVAVARFLLIRTVRLIRREWTKPQEPGA